MSGQRSMWSAIARPSRMRLRTFCGHLADVRASCFGDDRSREEHGARAWRHSAARPVRGHRGPADGAERKRPATSGSRNRPCRRCALGDDPLPPNGTGRTRCPSPSLRQTRGGGPHARRQPRLLRRARQAGAPHRPPRLANGPRSSRRVGAVGRAERSSLDGLSELSGSGSCVPSTWRAYFTSRRVSEIALACRRR